MAEVTMKRSRGIGGLDTTKILRFSVATVGDWVVLNDNGILTDDGNNIGLGDDIMVMRGSGAPVNGTSGTGVNQAGPGSFYIRLSNGAVYTNTNTISSPTWSQVGTVAALTDGHIFVGDGSNLAADVAMTGDVTISDAGVTAIGAAKVTSAMMHASLLRYATVTLTNSQIKNLRATPKTLVAAPGSNMLLEFVSASLELVAGASALTESAANMAVKYTDGSGVAVSQTIEATGFIDQVANTLTNALPKIDAIVAAASGLNNALVLHNTGAGEYAGNTENDATMIVKIAYRVHDYS